MSRSRQSSQIVFNCPIFQIRQDEYWLDHLAQSHAFYVIEPTNWINIIAITQTNQVVLIEQFRYGTAQLTLEIPGGMIDPGEDPLTAAQRELKEETGYEALEWALIGVNTPNPAIQHNHCYTFLATNAQLTDNQKLDHTEVIEVKLLPIKEIPHLIASQQIDHALVITAFYFYELAKKHCPSP